jgi:hypothetical protein
MNEELQQALAELINKSVSAGESAIAFTQEQLPEVIQQLLTWKLVESLIWFALSALFFLAGNTLTAVTILRSMKDPDSDSDFVLFMLFVALCGNAAIVIGTNVTWLQIWLAPKVYLIEYAASLAK